MRQSSLTVHLKVLISRDYRGDLPPNSIDKFLPLVVEAEVSSSPVVRKL